MQTIWTRIAQFGGSCRCPQCMSTVSGVSRRATIGASKRAPRYPTSSTLWYSGIFAAAATFDAGAKKRRRAQWDKAIEDVRRELEQPAETETQQQSQHGPTVIDGADWLRLEDERLNKDTQPRPQQGPSVSDGDSWPALEDERPYKDFQTQPQRGPTVIDGDSWLRLEDERLNKELVENLDSSSMRTRTPEWPVNTGGKMRRSNFPPQSIYATRRRKEWGDQTRWILKKLHRVELSSDILQLRIMTYLYGRGGLDAGLSEVPNSYASMMTMHPGERIETICQKMNDRTRLQGADPVLERWQRSPTDIPFCYYTQDDRGNFVETAREMNQSLQGLLKALARNEITKPACLAKIAYNLSVSPAPPNIDTYNTLIVGLSYVGEPEVTRMVVDSLCRDYVRPNEVTLASLLNHYTKLGDYDRFRYWMRRIRGLHGGLGAAHPDIVVTPNNTSRLRPNPDLVGVTLQLPHPTPLVFGTVVKGALNFLGFDAALRVCQKMGNARWGLSMSGLGPLLQDCANRRDWSSGLEVWNQIRALGRKSRKRAGRTWVSETIELPVLIAMLQLCSRCDQTDRFKGILYQAVTDHNVSAEEVIALVKHGLDGKDDLVFPEQISSDTDADDLLGVTVDLATNEKSEDLDRRVMMEALNNSRSGENLRTQDDKSELRVKDELKSPHDFATGSVTAMVQDHLHDLSQVSYMLGDHGLKKKPHAESCLSLD